MLREEFAFLFQTFSRSDPPGKAPLTRGRYVLKKEKKRKKIRIRLSHTGGVATPPGFAKPVAGCSHQKGAAYQSYLERPTEPTSRGGEYIHTSTTRRQEKQAQAGSPNGNSAGGTPTNLGERVKRSPNEIRAYVYFLCLFAYCCFKKSALCLFVQCINPKP